MPGGHRGQQCKKKELTPALPRNFAGRESAILFASDGQWEALNILQKSSRMSCEFCNERVDAGRK